MSSGVADNGYMYGAADGNPVAVTDGGNVATAMIYDRIINVGKMVLRKGTVYQLPDCPCVQVKMYAWDTNDGNIWLGGITTQRPKENVGLPLVPGARFEPYCTNSNFWSMTPDADGQNISIIILATAKANNVTISPSNPGDLNKTAPAIVTTTPANASVSQPINSSISILMNVALDPSTINTTNISVAPSITGFTVMQDSGNPANILVTYSGNLQGLTTFTFQVQNLKNFNGFPMTGLETFSFTTSNTTGPPDLVAPTITAYTPYPSGVTGVATSIDPTVTFSKAIVPASVTNTSIKLTNTDLVTFVTPLTFSLSPDQKTVTIIPPSALASGTNYRTDVFNTASAGAGIQGQNGIYLDQNYSMTFKTVIPYNTTYNVSGNTYQNLYHTGSQVYLIGEYLDSSSALYNKIPIFYSFTFQKVGAPTGNATISWQKIDHNYGSILSTVKTLYTLDVSTLGTTDTVISFYDAANTTPFAHYDAINIAYSGGSSSNYIKVKYSNTQAYDSSNTWVLTMSTGNTTADQHTSYDLAGVIGTSN